MNPEDYIQFEESYELSGNVFETGSSRQNINLRIFRRYSAYPFSYNPLSASYGDLTTIVCLHGRRFSSCFCLHLSDIICKGFT